MNKETVFSKLEGYTDVFNAKKVSRVYSRDLSLQGELASELVNRLHPKKLDLRVSLITTEMKNVKTFRLVSESGYLPPFEAGQYINLSVNINGVVTSRPYSISSPPGQVSYYELTVKRKPNGFVSNFLLDGIKQGDVLESTAPAGEFHHNPLFHGEDLVMIAGGSGITPMMSMIRDVTDRGLKRRIHLFYGSRSTDDIIYKQKLERLASNHENLTVDFVLSEPEEAYQGLTGFIDGKLLKDRLGDLTKKTFYLCGPEAMYKFCQKELEGLGLKRKQIRMEVFGPPADVTRLAGWPERDESDTSINIKLTDGREFEAPVGEPLLNSLDRAGLSVPSSCHSGECSLCRVRLLNGKVFQLPTTKIRVSDNQFGYIYSCSAYPTEDIEIEI